jgi:hypothetical protein
MADNRMKDWRTKLKDNGGAVLQVHLDKQSSDRLKALCFQYGMTKREVIENAIASYLKK